MSDNTQGPRPPAPNGFSAVVLSNSYEKVHYALLLASAAAAIGKPSVLFFSMGACHTLATRRADAPASGDPADAPGWHSLAPEPRFLDAQDQDTHYKARGIADMETLLSACAALGTRFIVCETGLRSIDLADDALRADLPIEVAGAVTWLTESPVGATTLLA